MVSSSEDDKNHSEENNPLDFFLKKFLLNHKYTNDYKVLV